jgi:hypothetical protein
MPTVLVCENLAVLKILERHFVYEKQKPAQLSQSPETADRRHFFMIAFLSDCHR